MRNECNDESLEFSEIENYCQMYSQMEAFIIESFIQAHYKLFILITVSAFLNPQFWKSLHIVSCLMFIVLEFHLKSFCIRCMFLIISLGTNNIWANNTIFDNANQISGKWYLKSSFLTPQLWWRFLWIQLSFSVHLFIGRSVYL